MGNREEFLKNYKINSEDFNKEIIELGDIEILNEIKEQKEYRYKFITRKGTTIIAKEDVSHAKVAIENLEFEGKEEEGNEKIFEAIIKGNVAIIDLCSENSKYLVMCYRENCLNDYQKNTINKLSELNYQIEEEICKEENLKEKLGVSELPPVVDGNVVDISAIKEEEQKIC